MYVAIIKATEMIFVGSKNLTIPAYLILSPRPTPRRKKWPRTNKEAENNPVLDQPRS